MSLLDKQEVQVICGLTALCARKCSDKIRHYRTRYTERRIIIKRKKKKNAKSLFILFTSIIIIIIASHVGAKNKKECTVKTETLTMPKVQ